MLPFLKNFRPARAGDIDAERVDACLALICWRIERNRKGPFPPILCFDRAVKVSCGFYPIHFVSTFARWQNGIDLDRNCLSLRTLGGWVGAVVFANERLSRATTSNVRIHK